MKRQKRYRDDHGYKRLTGKYSDESDDEETELFVKKTPYQEPSFVEKVIEEGDTLQAIAIRNRCTVEELKRLNHILNDNEIFAKGVIKVPDKPLSAILAGIHTSGRSSPQSGDHLKREQIEPKIDHTLLNLASTSSEDNNVNSVIFNTKLATKDVVESFEDALEDEEVRLIPKSTVIQPTAPSALSCNGADGDISWLALILLIVTLVVAVPLVFVYYIAEHQPLHNSTDHHQH